MRRGRNSQWLAAVSLLAMTTLFGSTMYGCKRGEQSATSAGKVASAPTKQMAKERFLNINNLNEPEYLDPGMQSGNVESNIALALFEGLVQYDPKDLHPIPGIAERWTLSDDKTIYTFHLRKNAKWSDGTPVTAHDFVYSWERVLNPKTGAKYAFILYYIKNGKPYNKGEISDPTQLGFRAVDDHTLEVKLEHPTPFILNLMCYATYKPVPNWVIEKHGSKWTRPENMVSNGAFMLKSWVPYKEVVAVKNPHYWDAANVKLDGVRFHPIEEKETALKMYEAGELDIDWEVPVMKAPSLMGRDDFVQGPYLASYFYRVNVTKPPMNNPKVRQALAYAIDRKTLTDKFLQKTEIASTSLVPEGMKGYTPQPGLAFNPEKAKQLLAEAGYADPSTLPPITIHYNTDDRHKLVAQVIQQMWKQHLGINVKLLNEEWKSYLKTQQLMNYQVSRSGWIADYPDANNYLNLFTSSSTLSHTGWKNDEYDALVAKAGAEPDVAQRRAYLEQAEAIILREAPVIPLYTYTKMMLVRPYVKGYYPNLQDIHPYKFVSLESDADASALKTSGN